MDEVGLFAVDADEPPEVAVEGPIRPTFDYHGEALPMASKIGLMPLLRFAHSAQAGLTTEDLEGLAAIYDMLRDCFADDETWARFQHLATVHRADHDELLGVVSTVIEQVTARPTGPPSASSAGQPPTGPRSTAEWSSADVPRALSMLDGRPDLQLVVVEAEEHRLGQRLG